MTSRSALILLCCLSPACDAPEPLPAAPVAAEERDPLVEALRCPGLAEPMTLESLDLAWAGTNPAINLNLQEYMDAEQLKTAQSFAELDDGEPCASYSEDGDTITASGDCPESGGLAFEGSMVVTQSAGVYETTWEDLSTRDEPLAISGDGSYRYESLTTDDSAFAIQGDRRWTGEGDEDLEGSFILHVEGAFGLPGEVLSGWIVAADSPEVPSGELCFAMTCSSDVWRVVGGRHSEADTSSECRFLLQGDRLWEESVSRTSTGKRCTTVEVDGELVESDCD